MSYSDDDDADWGWSGALVPLLTLVVVSCILFLLVGGMSQGRPFSGDPDSWRWLLMVVTVSAFIALIPVVVMLILSLGVGMFKGKVDLKRSYRDGLAAAWFFVLATNFGLWRAHDPLADIPRQRVVSITEPVNITDPMPYPE